MFSEGLGLLATPINNLADGFNNFIDGIGDFFSDLIDSLGNWFSDVWDSLGELNNNIGNWFEDLGTNIGGFFTDLRNSVSNWFSDVWNSLRELSNNIGNWFEGLGSSIAGFFSELSIKINTILSYLDPFSDNFFLKIAFIPSQEFIDMNNFRMRSLFEDKFTWIDNFRLIFEDIKTKLDEDSNAPQFNITLPERFGGKTVSIINFESFDSVRLLIKNIIRIFIWLFFIFKMYKKLPKIIY